MDLSQISLRERERGLVIGGVDTGKSTVAEALLVDYANRYAARGCRILIADTKPRFRAEYEVSGWRTKRRYKKWDHGPHVAGSVVVTDPDQMDIAWKTGHRILVAQANTGREIPMVVACVSKMFEESRAGRPSLVYVDETLDFFRGNGSPIGGDDALVRVARAGRERGMSGLYGAQRAKGLPGTLLSELSKLYLFRVDYIEDLKRLREMGAPPEVLARMPMISHTFMYWTKSDYRRVYGPYKLDLPRRRRRQAG